MECFHFETRSCNTIPCYTQLCSVFTSQCFDFSDIQLTKDYSTLFWLSCVCCCFICGLVALYKYAEMRRALKKGRLHMYIYAVANSQSDVNDMICGVQVQLHLPNKTTVWLLDFNTASKEVCREQKYMADVRDFECGEYIANSFGQRRYTNSDHHG